MTPGILRASVIDLSALFEAIEKRELEANREALQAYFDDLYAVNAVRNLTRVPAEEAAVRHGVDSLLVEPFLPEGAEVLDLGTGPGLPAFVLAATRPDLRVVALDSNQKMIGFLERHSLPNLTTVCERAETWGVVEAFDVVTGRALAPLGTQLELSAPPCRIGGLVIPFRTPADAEGLVHAAFGQLGLSLLDVIEPTLPGTDVVRLLPVYEKIRVSAPQYPRPWARIKASPLGLSARTQ